VAPRVDALAHAAEERPRRSHRTTLLTSGLAPPSTTGAAEPKGLSATSEPAKPCRYPGLATHQEAVRAQSNGHFGKQLRCNR
jgi:hypothetical protein